MDIHNVLPSNVTVYRVSNGGETAIGVYLVILGNCLIVLYSLYLNMVCFFLSFTTLKCLVRINNRWILYFFSLIGWLSWIGNGVVILLLTKQRKSLEPQDILTLNLAISDASIAIFGYSRGILEVFDVFRDEGYVIKTFWTCKVRGWFSPSCHLKLVWLSLFSGT